MAGAGNPNMVGMTKPGMLPNAPAAPVFSPQTSGPGAIPPYANPGTVPTPPPAGAPATGGGKGGGRSEPPIAAPPPSIPAAPRQPNINQTAADGINRSISCAGS